MVWMRTGCLLFKRNVLTTFLAGFPLEDVGSHRILHKEPFGHPKISHFLSDEKLLWQQKKITKPGRTHRSTTFWDSWGFVEIRGDSWRFVGIRGDSWRFVEIRGDSWRFVEIRGTFVEIRGTFVEIRGLCSYVVFNIRGDSWGFVGFRGVSWVFVVFCGSHFRNRGKCALTKFHANLPRKHISFKSSGPRVSSVILCSFCLQRFLLLQEKFAEKGKSFPHPHLFPIHRCRSKRTWAKEASVCWQRLASCCHLSK